MFLHSDKYKFQEGLSIPVFYPEGHEFATIMTEKPKQLILLGDSDWPKEVKDKIAKAFRDIGIENPLTQKLVEPFAVAFGGVYDGSGEYKFEDVNWELAVDYFLHEAKTVTADTDEEMEELKKAQDKHIEKYGFAFSHKYIYKDPSDRMADWF